MWTQVFWLKAWCSEFNKFSCISEKHRKSTAAQSSSQCLHKIIEFNKLGKNFLLFPHSFSHHLCITLLEWTQNSLHFNKIHMLVKGKNDFPAMNPVTRLIQIHLAQSPTSSLFHNIFSVLSGSQTLWCLVGPFLLVNWTILFRPL